MGHPREHYMLDPHIRRLIEKHHITKEQAEELHESISSLESELLEKFKNTTDS